MTTSSAADYIDTLIEKLKKGLRAYIKEHADRIEFNQGLYNIIKNEDCNYTIVISIPGLGTQKLSFSLSGDRLLIDSSRPILGKGQMPYPSELIRDLYGALGELHLLQSNEDIAIGKAKALARDSDDTIKALESGMPDRY